MLGLIEYTRADIINDAFLEQDTVLVLKHNLLDTKTVLEGIYLFCRVLQRLKGRTVSSKCSADTKSGNTPGAKAATAATASTLDIASVRKGLKNKKLQRYTYI